MASRSLYPPIVDSYSPAFIAGKTEGVCNLYFSLSKFNSVSDFKSVQLSIYQKSTNINVVNTAVSGQKTGIVLDIPFNAVEDESNLYYISIPASFVSGGWTIGELYKLQIRLSSVNYSNADSSHLAEAAWLNTNANKFSEWSTVCITKVISPIEITIKELEYDSFKKAETSNEEKIMYISTLSLHGKIFCPGDPSELIHSYQIDLFDDKMKLVETSGVKYTDSYQDNGNFVFISKTELESGAEYVIRVSYLTKNYFESFEEIKVNISMLPDEEELYVYTVDSKVGEGLLKDYSTFYREEEEGYIALKLYRPKEGTFSANICIRRTDDTSDFKLWEDFKIITVKAANVNRLDPIYDLTIESGRYYKYGVQVIDIYGNRSELKEMTTPIRREFEFSYLLGKGNHQLKLQFNNEINNFKINYSDSVNNTIGGKYPNIRRNGNMQYKTFPLNGLISFNMDNNDFFVKKNFVYGYEYDDDVVGSHLTVDQKTHALESTAGQPHATIDMYDYSYERFFREKVYDFLYDEKPKLFKSPTEGNIIVRLTDVSFTPEKSLNRMIYSFSATAYEISECNLDNFTYFGLHTVGNIDSDLSTYETRVGQIILDIYPGQNIIEAIYDKYDSTGRGQAGYEKSLVQLRNVRVTVNEKPFRIKTKEGRIVTGHNLVYSRNNNKQQITMFSYFRPIYEFDPLVKFTKTDSLTLLGDLDKLVTSINVCVDFLYDLRIDKKRNKQIESKTIRRTVGQLFENYSPGTSIYRHIYSKYYVEWEDSFVRLQKLSGVKIEATPGVVVGIIDSRDGSFLNSTRYHEINATGLLALDEVVSFTDIRYVGIRKEDGTVDTTVNADIKTDYSCYIANGTYKKEASQSAE